MAHKVDGVRPRLAAQSLSAPATKVPIVDIQWAVAHAFDLPMGDLRNRWRRGKIVRARHIAMFLARELSGRSLSAIGRMFGNRDHTSVMYACWRVRTVYLSNPGWAALIDRIRGELANAMEAPMA
jgi:chromosomal replication initiator protein